AGIGLDQVSAIFLVGGSSRIPLAATLLHRAFGLAPTAIEQPELVVAEGSLYLAPRTGRAMVAGAGAGGPSPVSGPPVPTRPTSGGPGAPVSAVPTSGSPAAPVSASPFQIPSSAPSAAFPPSTDEPSVDFAADPGGHAGPGMPIPPPPGPNPGYRPHTPNEALASSNDPTQVRPASGPPAGFPSPGYPAQGQGYPAQPTSGQ